jgi:hypothetical protein
MNKKLGHIESDNFTKFNISLSSDIELFLDRLKMDIREKSGARMSRSELIRAAIRYVKTLKPSLSSVKNETDLLNALQEASRKK